MKYIVAFLLAASVATAYITPPDKVVIDGRILLTSSRPMASFPWKGEPPRISEYPNEETSDSRELDAFWEIRDGQLYLLAVSAFRFDEFAPFRSIGLRELMPERIKDGKVLADWFTGDFEVLEIKRVDRRLLLRPQDVPPTRVATRKFHVEKGRVKEEPNQQSPAFSASPLKPRMVVLTDIAPNDVEPDDTESTIRLLVHADLFEIEALVATTGWSNDGGFERPDILHELINAYEKDLPNLLKRSAQQEFLPDESRQQVGYWPSPRYLRERTVLGSKTLGQAFIGEANRSPGSDLIVRLADEKDDRPLWVAVWGGGNTVAQAVWQVQQTRSPADLKAFLRKLHVYTITDQDAAQKIGNTINYSDSSHQWMRREFADDLMFLWDECAWKFQNNTGKSHWAEYEALIQNHGNLGSLYPKYKWGVEGDTPSFLYLMPVGLSDPEVPGQGGWGGFFERGQGPDTTTVAYVNQQGSANATSTKYQKQFYPAIFNNFAARMAWAQDGKGNRNPIVAIKDDRGLGILTNTSTAGTTVTLDASKSTDPDGDKLFFKWWILPEAGTYPSEIALANADTNTATLIIPPDAAGKSFHVVCEVTDDGTPSLTSYRRIIFQPPAR